MAGDINSLNLLVFLTADAVLLDISESSSGPEFSSISPHLINIKDKTISSSKVDKNLSL